nr:alpha/beta hydrolase [Neobacillus sp. Marseille-Q6967]
MRKNVVNLNGSTLSYIDEGHGSPMVLLHGFCGGKGYWDHVIPGLAKNFRVIAVDLPGHGESSNIESNLTIDIIAEHVKIVVDHLNLQKVTLFGHSLGGYITLAFAEKYSSQLNGFSLIHSTAFSDSEEAKKGREANVEKVKKEGITALIEGLVPKLFSPDNLEKNAEDVQSAKEIGYLTSAQGAVQTLIAMKDRPDRNHVLEGTSLPVLLIAGEKDQIIPVEKTFSVSKSNIQQVVIKGSGHMSMYENPSELVNVVNEFMNRQ